MSAYAIFIRKAARRSVLANDGADGDHLPADRVSDHRTRRNKALALEAMTSLFQRHDAPALDQLYSQDYIQHNPDIAQGRDALAGAGRRAAGGTGYYEPGLGIAGDDLVAIPGRIRGWAKKLQVVTDIFRVDGGKLAEHWDVLQNEAPAAFGAAGRAMFDPDEIHAKT